MVANAICQLLQNLRAEYLLAPTLETARQLLASHAGNLTLVLSDINLPDGSGFQPVKHVRQTDNGLLGMYMSGCSDQLSDKLQ